MARSRPLAAVVALTAVATACAEAPAQHAARLAVERVSQRASRTGDTRCTSNSRILFAEGPAASVFVCLVKVEAGRCDRYVVRREGKRYAVRLKQRNGDCILPAA